MPESAQTYENHVRYHIPFHFVLSPLLLLNLVWSIVTVVREPGAEAMKDLLVAFLLALIGFLARTNALKAQDRVIRLEERLRYQHVLPAELAKRAEALKTGQIIALRFASDEELPELVEQSLAGKFASVKEIKLAIKQWRGDYLRV
ncbi:MAG: hypothetical protein JNM09_15510 [Blastocatellia bacterium]|nr:hypothetical protein [Blastocatellia bacterium]